MGQTINLGTYAALQHTAIGRLKARSFLWLASSWARIGSSNRKRYM